MLSIAPRSAGDELLPHYLALPTDEWPEVIVFDADSYCGLDLAHALRIPAVARVGTGLRDAHSTPLYVPLYSSGKEAPKSLMQRLTNAALLTLSRHVISPVLLPRIYSRDRARFVAQADAHFASLGIGPPRVDVPGAHPSAVADFLSHRGSAMRHDLLWDGQHALYNSHWGLEYPRPTFPFEHAIGHTTDFVGDAAQLLPKHAQAFLDGALAENVSVVYVAMGTLSVLPPAWMRSLASAICDAVTSADGRVAALWVVPSAQQADVPVCRRVGDKGLPPVLLADWLPQTAALRHGAVKAFVTHGGMNSVGEGTFAQRPMLCIPLFSDQPDNCARIADRGLGEALPARVNNGGIQSGVFGSALHRLIDGGQSYQATLRRAWDANVAAGGVDRAVRVIEAAAREGYGGHLAHIPAIYYQPWYQAASLDVWITAAVAIIIFIKALLRLVCRVDRSCDCKRTCKGGRSDDLRSGQQKRD